jgi:transcriptional regulator with XRE-family HTH domain
MTSFEPLLNAIGRAVREQRAFKRLTQQQLISKVHKLGDDADGKRQLAQETLSRIENGRFNPSLKQLFLISTALGISLADLVFIAQKIAQEEANERT